MSEKPILGIGSLAELLIGLLERWIQHDPVLLVLPQFAS